MPNQSQEQYTAAHDHSHDHPHVHSHQHHHDHVHDHHQHDIHEHKHDHDHHHHHDHDHHHHHHHYPAVSIPPFPSWSDIFVQLAPMQKTIFTWFLIHGGIGILVWWVGASRDSLGKSYQLFQE